MTPRLTSHFGRFLGVALRCAHRAAAVAAYAAAIRARLAERGDLHAAALTNSTSTAVRLDLSIEGSRLSMKKSFVL